MSDNATADEIRQAIEGLSDTDGYQISKAARSFVHGSDYADPDELMNEAIARALHGAEKVDGRHWPREIGFVPFLVMTMKSIADASRKSVGVTRTDSADAVETRDADADDAGVCRAPSVLDELVAKEDAALLAARAATDLAAIEKHFEKDDDVLWLICCLREERDPSKARESTGMSNTEYETTRRRFRRGLERLYPERSKR